MQDYLIIIEQAENNYSAYSPDIDGCIATGQTPEEARKNYLEALEMHLEGLKEDGLEIPKPTAKFSFTTEDCSGVINIRTSKSVHSKLTRLAKEEHVSVSHLVNDAIVKMYG